MKKSDRDRLATLIGELADLASYRDIDTACEIVRSAASVLGIDPATVPGYTNLTSL